MPDKEDSAKTIEAIQSLEKSVDRLSDTAKLNRADINRQRTLIKWTIISLLADAVITAAIAFGGYTIENLQSEQRDSTSLTRANQCSLVNLFIQFEKTSVSNPTITPEEKQQRVVSFAQMHKIHDDLKCPTV